MPINRKTGKLWYKHTLGYYTTVKIIVTPHISSDESHTMLFKNQKDTYDTVSFIQYFKQYIYNEREKQGMINTTCRVAVLPL